MLILLPPSEGKSNPARGRPIQPERLSSPVLQPARAKVLAALVDLCTAVDPCTTVSPADLERAVDVLGVGTTQSHEVARNADLGSAHATRADKLYAGVLYEALDLSSLEGSAKRRATAWLVIVSGLFGLVRPGDHIPAYRLSGDVTLPGIGNLASFWREHLDQPIVEAAGRGLVVDLRSSTYATFWRPDPQLAKRVATVRVLHEVDGTRKVVSHFNKATKGRLVRHLLEDGGSPNSPKAFAAHLKSLGWDVEVGEPGRHGTALDVVVSDL